MAWKHWESFVPPGVIRPDGRVQRTQAKPGKPVKDDLLLLHCRALKLPEPVREWRVCSTRRWRYDYAWIDFKLALEVQGGLFLPNGGGRHNRGAALVKEQEKLNMAALLGWRVVFTTPADVESGAVWNWLEPMLRAEVR